MFDESVSIDKLDIQTLPFSSKQYNHEPKIREYTLGPQPITIYLHLGFRTTQSAMHSCT